MASNPRYLRGYDTLFTTNLYGFKPFDGTSASDYTKMIVDDIYVLVNNVWRKVSATTLSASGSLGTNYYINVNSSGTPSISTTKGGNGSTSSTCIGGFHWGRIRKSTTANDVVTGGGVVPNSVWTNLFRPACANPNAMVYIGNGLWGDIYLTRSNSNASSGIGGSVYDSSAYGSNPCTGTENYNWYTFVENLAKVGKRLPTYAEFVYAANGSPAGQDGNNTYAWSKNSNTARTTCGAVQYAISSLNICDLVGNVWKWLDDCAIRTDGNNPGWNWRDVLGSGKGKAYIYNDIQLIALLAGGYWIDGAGCGSRAVLTSDCPWNLSAYVGAWSVSNSI